MTVLASKPIVEDSLEIAQSLRRAWTLDDVNDPRLEQLRHMERHLSDLLHTPPDQMVQDGTSTIEDYLDDAKQPQMAAQVKQEVDMIAKWRRQQRPLKSPHDYENGAGASGMPNVGVCRKSEPIRDPEKENKERDFVPEGNQRVCCNQCEMVSLNSVPCHETGCPNEHTLSDPNALSVHPSSHLIECSALDYRGYRNWATEHIAALIDKSEWTLNTKHRLALNALRKGIGIEQLADQFRRLFKRQEDETRKYYEDSVTTGGDEYGGEVDWRAIACSAAEEVQKYKAQDGELQKKAREGTEYKKEPLEFRFRLNGEIMPEIFVQRALVDGEPVGVWQIVVDIDGIGRFTIDDNSNLWDSALPQFVLEFRDETSWALLPIPERQASVDKGWHRVTPQELVAILQSEGIISTE